MHAHYMYMKQMNILLHTWISLGKVAENIMVCLSPICGIVSCSTIRLICGSNPMSSIRSASSSTRKLHQREKEGGREGGREREAEEREGKEM